MNRKSEAQARYDANHTARIYIKLNTDTDADILSYLEGKNKQGAVKEALRAQIVGNRALLLALRCKDGRRK